MCSWLWEPLTSQDKAQAKDKEAHGDNCTHWHLLLMTRMTPGDTNIPSWILCWGFQLCVTATDHCVTSGKLIFHQPQWRGAQTFVLLLCEGASSRARVNEFLPSEVNTTFTQHSRKLQKHPGSDTELRGAPATSLIHSQLLKILQTEKNTFFIRKVQVYILPQY